VEKKITLPRLRGNTQKPKKPCTPLTLALLPGSLTVEDIACHSRVKGKAVREWLKKGLLVGWKNGSGDWVVRKSSYENFIARRMNIDRDGIKLR